MPATSASAPSIGFSPLQTGASLAAIENWLDLERDQLPLWLPVALGLGIAAWFALPNPSWWIGFMLGAAAVAAAGLGLGVGMRIGRALLWLGLAALIGVALIWWRAERVEAPRLERAQMVAATGVIQSFQRLPAREAIRLIVRIEDAKRPITARINIPADKAPAELAAGARIRFRAWLMPPPPMAVPGAYDFARTAWFQGIGATGRALGDVEITAPAKANGWRPTIAAWRQALADHAAARLPSGAGGIAAALATGDQNAIPETDAEAMRRSGLAHLLSVSGLHLTAVVGAVMLLVLKLLALSPVLALRFRLVLIAAGAGALAGVAYTLLTGADVPTVRACIAALLVLAGIALGRDALTLRLVAVGALIVLLLWPESLAGPSFQMSFAAITALVALHEHPRVRALLMRRDEGVAQRFGRIVLGLILTGLAVEIALTPIALYHFHKAGLYGALANLVAIPLTTFIIMPLEALALLFDTVGLGGPFWWLAGKALTFLLALAHGVATAPGAVTMLPAMPRAAFALMICGGIWIALWRSGARWLGAFPFAAGALWAVMTPAPDLLVTGDGRHLALRGSGGEWAVLRPRAGDYVRDMLSETAGHDGELKDLDALPVASCNADLCAMRLTRDGRTWHILATRSAHQIEIEPLKRACAAADIVISERILPRTCIPRWLKADRALLARSGGLSVTLGAMGDVTTVAERVGGHPWAVDPPKASLFGSRVGGGWRNRQPRNRESRQPRRTE